MNDLSLHKEEAPLWGLLVLLFGALIQYLLVDQTLGASVPVMVTSYYGLFLCFSKGKTERGEPLKSHPILLYAPLIFVALLTLPYLFYDNELFRVLNVPALSVLLVLHPILMRQGTAPRRETGGWIGAIAYAGVGAPLERLPVPFRLLSDRLKVKKLDSPTAKRLRPVALGILMALPVLFISLLLLASADRIFLSWISWIPDTLQKISIGEGIARLLFALVIALYTFCFLWALVVDRLGDSHNRMDRELQTVHSGELSADPLKPRPGARLSEPFRLDPLAAATFLVCMNALYVLFAFVQFTYLFGAAQGLLPDGVNYADYARQGFAQLVLVALINLGILLIGLHVVRPGSAGLDRLRKVLLSLLVGCTLVMLGSAYTRLSLYEDAYGYTLLRLLVHGFMLYLGALLITALVRIWRESFSLPKLFFAISLVAYILMNYANLDALIAKNNCDRYERTGKIDVSYLGTLSSDAYPALSRFQEKHPDVEGLLQTVTEMKHEARASNQQGWQSWNLANWRAAKE
ncbi:DUF4153 domain-containing protein [Gorillibacterium timonense]|uniref:DUF4153 domain-containing protein n=1 Tax=Gorillibacterium timonense TaxID=1689269 RepID=UPI00071D1DF9|nr:DUF4173 domain-containing protein [Gorillibacterium timonense]